SRSLRADDRFQEHQTYFAPREAVNQLFFCASTPNRWRMSAYARQKECRCFFDNGQNVLSRSGPLLRTQICESNPQSVPSGHYCDCLSAQSDNEPKYFPLLA